MVCPLYFVSEKFEQCIASWLEFVPINKLFIGIGRTEVCERIPKDDRIIYIDQRDNLTLGYSLKQLFETVSTEYFIYFHDDVEIYNTWFPQMWEKRIDGILESSKFFHLPYGGKQYRKIRAYSGAQLIKTSTVQDLDWEDDFIYASEDIILQEIILERGFQYKKVIVPHIHYIRKNVRSQDRLTMLEWQIKAIIKYLPPKDSFQNYVRSLIRVIKKEYNVDFDPREFISQENPSWFPHNLTF